MSKRNLENQKLERIGRELLQAGRMSDEQLEKIIAAPNLFARVEAEIKTAKARRSSPVLSASGADLLRIWSWQKAGVSLLILIVGAVVGIGLLRSKNGDLSKAAKGNVSAEIQKATAFVENPPPDLPAADSNFGKAQNPFGRRRSKPEKIAFKNTDRKTAKRLPRENQLKRRATVRNNPEDVFYALPFAGNTEAEDLRIVRTELSPKSLFALGINVAVENESAKIKTDLLVGADGVARAIRFVK